MFQPNSIKSLREIKAHRDIENKILSQSIEIAKDEDNFNIKKDLFNIQIQNCSELSGPLGMAIQTKNMIGEVNQKIQEIQNWRQQQSEEIKQLKGLDQLKMKPNKIKQNIQVDDEDIQKYKDQLQMMEQELENKKVIQIQNEEEIIYIDEFLDQVNQKYEQIKNQCAIQEEATHIRFKQQQENDSQFKQIQFNFENRLESSKIIQEVDNQKLKKQMDDIDKELQELEDLMNY